MSQIISFSDLNTASPDRTATVKLANGEQCVINIGPYGAVVKKVGLNFLGSSLYRESNVGIVIVLAGALSEYFPINLLPKGFNNPILSAFTNAALHCSTSIEVKLTLNKPVTIKIPVENGLNPESAIHIQATNSAEGIPKEYGALIALFGKPNRDWKHISRSVISYKGRTLEKFIISVSNRRTEVYFDITTWTNNNFWKEVSSNTLTLQENSKENVNIILPKEELFTLEVILLSFNKQQLEQLGISAQYRKELLDPIIIGLLPWKEYNKIPDHVEISMRFSMWSTVEILLGLLNPVSLLQEEEIENLKAIIGGKLRPRKRKL